MTDYTPTTEEVELYFKQAVPEPYGQELDDAFDRWLAEVKEAAWQEGFKRGYGWAHNPYRQDV